jgi:hypothetical protein
MHLIRFVTVGIPMILPSAIFLAVMRMFFLAVMPIFFLAVMHIFFLAAIDRRW